MIIGNGVDIIEVERIKEAADRWGDAFLGRVFTEREIESAKKKKYIFQHLAARFATKEAVVKAFANGGQKVVHWKDIEVSNDNNGKPIIILYGVYSQLMKEWKVREITVSMSHTKDYALSTVLLIGNVASR